MPEEVKNTALEKEYRAIEKEYKRDVAIVEARPLLSEVFFAIWALVDITLITISFMIVVPYISSGVFVDARAQASIGYNTRGIRAVSLAQGAETLNVGSAKVVSGKSGVYDLMGSVENPNAYWYPTFTYYFSFDGGESEKIEGFVMPLEKATFVSLETAVTGVPRNVRLILENISWHRISRHEVTHVEGWLADRNAFTVSDIVYENNLGLDGAAIGRTDFLLTNRSPYGYWEPKFLIFLERSGAVAAVTEVKINDLPSGATHPVNIRWFDQIPSSATIRVEPVINYFDKSIYMRPEE